MSWSAKLRLFALAALAVALVGSLGCRPEGPGPIGALDGQPQVVFAPLTEDGEVVADVDITRYQGLGMRSS